MLDLHVLPARQGDAIWVEWGACEPTHRMIIDMGTVEIGRQMHRRLADCDASRRRFELLLVTHIDSDHIGGVLSCLVDASVALEDLRFDDVWFNGLTHLEPPRPRTLEEQGGVQGRKLSAWLERQSWNRAFGGGPVCRVEAPPVVELAGGLLVTVLGPTPNRLAALAPVWRREVALALKRMRERAAAVPGLEPMGRRKSQTKPRLTKRDDLSRLAAKVTGSDPSEANGSSIAVLLEHGRHRVLLAGDAYADDLLDGIRSLGRPLPIRLDAFKVSHHGSRENTTRALLEAVDCPQFLFSTDGTQFEHPDQETVACVIDAARRRPVNLAFNSRSKFTEWWANESWKKMYGYEANYGTKDGGLTIRLRE